MLDVPVKQNEHFFAIFASSMLDPFMGVHVFLRIAFECTLMAVQFTCSVMNPLIMWMLWEIVEQIESEVFVVHQGVSDQIMIYIFQIKETSKNLYAFSNWTAALTCVCFDIENDRANTFLQCGHVLL